MTICHTPNDEGEFTDDQLTEHLIHSACSECVSAGFRFKKLQRVGVAAVLIQDNGDDPLIYLLRHKKDDRWVLPGGKLEAGETPLDGIIREVYEECGIHPRFYASTFAANPDVPSSPIMLYFYARLRPIDVFQIHNAEPEKHSHLSPFAVKDMDGRPMWDTDRYAIGVALDAIR